MVWNVDPVMLRVGSVAVRYYGVCFGLAIATTFLIWRRRALRSGASSEVADSLLWYGIPAVVVGGRLGYVLFYAPRDFVRHPWDAFAIWQGGIASHGVAIGLVIALWAFSRRYGIPWLRLADCLAPALALGVGFVRLGNFFNSEILGRASSVPWAIVFARRDAVPRHPAQLYDLLIGPITYAVLRAVERRYPDRAGSGLVAGAFLAVYFGLRIFVEQYKDFYVEQVRTLEPFATIERWVGAPIHTGQWLSVIPVCVGLVLLVRAMPLGTRMRTQAVAS